MIPKIFGRTFNPCLVDKENYYAFSSNTAPWFSKNKNISTKIILWSMLGQNFYLKYSNKWKKGTKYQGIDFRRFLKEKLNLIEDKYYQLTKHLSNVYYFTTKNLKRYTDLRKDVSLLLQNYATIDFETKNPYLKDMILEADKNF